jgi:N-acetylmuramoyl-L-alanine amidase
MRRAVVLSFTAFALAAQAAPAPVAMREDCGLEPPAVALRAGPPPRRPWETGARARKSVGPVVTRLHAGRARAGALAGKTVYVSAGHGWVFTAGAWRTQRGNTNGIIEDLVSAEAIDQYLVDELERMGAHVVTVREHDMNAGLVVVDDADATLEGGLVELAAGPPGWGALPTPIADQSNPFAAGGTRVLSTTTQARGRAVFHPAIPADGYYDVSVSYAAGTDRAPDAHVVVRHAGGETEFRVDQRHHGSTWVRLGRFWFVKDAPPATASVAILDDSATPGAVVSLDAVRFGGGQNPFDRGGGLLGRPMYESGARYQAQLMGAPPTVWDYTDTDANDDVGTRSRFSAWDHEDGEDAVYIAWHTNAPNPGRGTESYVYGPNAPPSPLSEFSGVAGSLELQKAVHDELVGDIRAAWDSTWKDRGKFTAYFGEVNPNHNPETPAVLVEVGFHDTPAEADSIRDPRFRRIATRAMAQGVAKYFATRDGAPLVLPSEAPTGVRVVNAGAGVLHVAWRAPASVPGGGDAADGYRVYVGQDGHSFDEGTDVTGTSFDLTGLSAGDVRYVRVAALNAGGESPASELLGASVAASGRAQALVVGGFHRLDRGQLVKEDLSEVLVDLGVVDRMFLDRMNDGSYAGRHGAAIAAARVSFDSAESDAVEQGDVVLAAYRVVDWFVGEESVADVPLDDAERAALTSYLASGGRIFLTGSELGYALDLMGTPDTQAFLRQTLHVMFVADDAGTLAVTPALGPFQTIPSFSFGDDGEGGYLVDYPDEIDPAPTSGAAAVMTYMGGGSGDGTGAAVAWGADGPASADRGVVFGFPFETIAGENVRAAVMAKALAYLGVTPDQPELGPDAGPGGGDTGVDGGCGCRAGGRGGRGSTVVVVVLLLGLISARRVGTLRDR